MNFSRIAAIFLSVLLVVEAALIWSEWRELHAGHAEVAQNGDLRARLNQAERHVADLRAAIAHEQARADERARAVAAAKTRQAQAAAGNGGDARRNGMKLTAQALLNALDNPRFRAALTTVDRDYNLRETAPFLRSMGLNPDQVNHMLDLIGQMMIAKMDGNQSANVNDLNHPDRNSLIVQTQQDIATQMQAYLGDQQYAAYQQWVGEGSLRAVTSSLQSSLSYTSAPLSDAQAQQLAQAMYQTIPDGKPDTTGIGALFPMEPNQMPRLPTLTAAQIAAAQTVLTPAQAAALQALVAQQQAMALLRRTGP